MNEEGMNTTGTESASKASPSPRKQRKWLIAVVVLVVILLAEVLRSRSAATDIVRAGSQNFTEHVSTSPHLYCGQHLSGQGLHWHVTFAVPAARLAGRDAPVSAESTSYVSWSDTWDKDGAIRERSQRMMYR